MNEKVRRQISYEAARLMYARSETEYHRAKLRAARMVVRGWVRASDLPTNREIRDEIQIWARLQKSGRGADVLLEMRRSALELMQALRPLRPRLVGSVLAGDVQPDSVVEIYVFADHPADATELFDEEGITYQLGDAPSDVDGPLATYRVCDRFEHAIRVLPRSEAAAHTTTSRSRASGWATIGDLEQMMRQEPLEPETNVSEGAIDVDADRFQVYESLLLPLEHVKQNPKRHPEGDALYHSLQVFELVREELPYDEEVLLAALLHDVGKAIDPRDHVLAGLEALEGAISERTEWLITHLADAQALREGKLGIRSRRRLEAHESFEELVLLARCDRAGRQRGARTSTVDEALEYVRELARMCG